MDAGASRPHPGRSTALAKEGQARVSETPETTHPHNAILLTAAQLAERWQVPIRTVYAWARRNAVPHYRAGRLLRFDPIAVEEHFRRHGFAEELVADPERPGESAFSLLKA
jgi:excisionase family DNA binding protein